ncbi:MAG: hypothetical protein AAFU85_13685 [Planctomycetota bacterium]
MIHYTCDRCKHAIDPETESRYVVEIDIRLAGEGDHFGEGTEDLDQLSELHDQLQRESSGELATGLAEKSCEIEAVGCFEGENGSEQFDLCAQCYEAFVSNPLGREIAVGLGFSNN